VPHEHEWTIEGAAEPSDAPRYRRIADLGALEALVRVIG
jgi:hypothetical protein